MHCCLRLTGNVYNYCEWEFVRASPLPQDPIAVQSWAAGRGSVRAVLALLGRPADPERSCNAGHTRVKPDARERCVRCRYQHPLNSVCLRGCLALSIRVIPRWLCYDSDTRGRIKVRLEFIRTYVPSTLTKTNWRGKTRNYIRLLTYNSFAGSRLT